MVPARQQQEEVEQVERGGEGTAQAHRQQATARPLQGIRRNSFQQGSLCWDLRLYKLTVRFVFLLQDIVWNGLGVDKFFYFYNLAIIF